MRGKADDSDVIKMEETQWDDDETLQAGEKRKASIYDEPLVVTNGEKEPLVNFFLSLFFSAYNMFSVSLP